MGYEPTLVQELAISETDHCLEVFQKLTNNTNIIICIGVPIHQSAGICISMIIFQPNMPRIVYSKQILHVDEYPYFISGKEPIFISYKDHKIAPAICFESLPNEHAATASAHGADIYLASVVKSAKGVEKVNLHYTEIAKNLSLTVLMANAIGPSDDFMSAGNSAVWNEY